MIQIKTTTGEVLLESEKDTIKDALEDAVKKDAYLRDANLRDANLRDANLRDANLRDAYLRGAYLRGANLWGADFYKTTFYGRGGNTKIKKSQIDDFLAALGVVAED